MQAPKNLLIRWALLLFSLPPASSTLSPSPPPLPPPHLVTAPTFVCCTLVTIRIWHAPEIMADAVHHGILTLTLPPPLLSVCSTLGTIRLWHAPEIVAEAEHHGVLVAPSAMDKAMSSAARQQSKAYGEIHRYLDQNLSIYIDPGLPCASHKPVCLPAHAPLSHVNPPPMCSRGAGRAVPGRQYRRRLPTGIPAGQRRRWRL